MPVPRALLIAALVLAALFFGAGCDSLHVGGTEDRQLEYRIERDADDDESDPLPSPEEARDRVQIRLASAQVTADVAVVDGSSAGGESVEKHVRVTLDSRLVDGAKRMIHWRGGTQLYRLNKKLVVEPDPKSVHGIEKKIENGEVYWIGPSGNVWDAIATAKVPKNVVVLAQYLGSGLARTRVIWSTPLVDFSDTAKVVFGIGKTPDRRAVQILLTPAAIDAVRRAESDYPDAEVAIVRAGAVLGTEPIASIQQETPIVVSFGDDVIAYSLAAAELRILKTPVLPLLSLVDKERVVPTRWGIAATCILLPFVVALGWLLFVRKFDRARPEPIWLVGATFALGCASIVPALLLERLIMQSTPYLDPFVMTKGGDDLGAFPLALPIYVLSVGIIEEGAKFIAAWSLARHRREFDEPVDGIVYATAASLGFAAIENMKYFGDSRLSSVVIVGRTFMSMPVHMFFGAIWGYAMGRKLVRRKTRVWAYFLLAAIAHGTFDTLLSFDDLNLRALFSKLGAKVDVPLANLLLLGLGLVFVWLLRKSLRHGAVAAKQKFSLDDEAPVPESKDRLLLRMGEPTVFVACVVAMLAAAYVVIQLFTQNAYSGLRADAGFFVKNGVVLAIFGVAAYGVAATIPLDAAIDARGITFAGATNAWSTITGIERSETSTPFGPRGSITLLTTNGNVRLGPAPPAKIEQLAATVSWHLGQRAPVGSSTASTGSP